MAEGLNSKQIRFCNEYIIDLNATQAAIRSGYSPKTAYSQGNRMLKNVEVQKYIKELMEAKDAELIASQNEVLKYLTSVLRGESKSEVVVIEAIEDVGTRARSFEKGPDEKERLKAAELIGKRYGIYTDKIEADIDAEINIKIDYGDNEEQ